MKKMNVVLTLAMLVGCVGQGAYAMKKYPNRSDADNIRVSNTSNPSNGRFLIIRNEGRRLAPGECFSTILIGSGSWDISLDNIGSNAYTYIFKWNVSSTGNSSFELIKTSEGLYPKGHRTIVNGPKAIISSPFGPDSELHLFESE